MTPKVCPHCQRVHPPHRLRCPETRALLDLEGRELQGRYRLVRRIGQSAHAWVWQAEHRVTGRKVVIKMLRPEHLDDLALLSRFEQEASLGGRIHSDHVVPIFDQGHSEAGPFLVMDWAPGETLQERLVQDHAQAGPWPLPMVLRWAKGVASALMAIHQAGVVHRDLKPSNMIVQGHGERLGVKLLDFGVAKNLCHQGDTAVGSLLGTQAYMPPEQRCDAANVDERADLYAFGVIFDQLLRGLDEPGSHRAPLRELRDIPEAWRALHASLLAQDPQDRPASARSLHQALCQLESTPAAVATAREFSSPARGWGGLVAGLALGGGIGWLAHTDPKTPATGSLADVPGRGVVDASVVSTAASPSAWARGGPPLEPGDPGPQCLALDPVGSVPAARSVQKGPRAAVGGTSAPSRARSQALKPRPKVLLSKPLKSVDPRPVWARSGVSLGQAAAPPRVKSRASASTLKDARASGTPFVSGSLRALDERSSPMGFFDARQYCSALARAGHKGVHSWRLAFPDELARWAHVKEIRRGWYWTDALKAGRAQVVALPSKRRFMARVRRRFIRPFCVAPLLEDAQGNGQMIKR